MTRSLFLLLVSAFLSFTVFAQPTEIYTIQIGTYKQFAEETRKTVLQYGVVHVLTYENLSRVTVGEFTNREAAAEVLHNLKDAGFKDAFIRQIGYVDLEQIQSNIEKFNVLIAEMDAQVFYLDGRKYIFAGHGYIEIRK